MLDIFRTFKKQYSESEINERRHQVDGVLHHMMLNQFVYNTVMV